MLRMGTAGVAFSWGAVARLGNPLSDGCIRIRMLQVVETMVDATAGKQLIVRSNFTDFSGVKDHDFIRFRMVERRCAITRTVLRFIRAVKAC